LAERIAIFKFFFNNQHHNFKTDKRAKMETLYGRFQTADSSNQYNPYKPGQVVMDHPCMRTPSGACISRINHRAGSSDQWVSNPPPEESVYMQKEDDPDVRSVGSATHGHHPKYLSTVGTGASDISRGQMLMGSAGDMPIVRRTAYFDTRYRNVGVFPDAGNVVFDIETPLTSVSRIALVAARVPINLTSNSGLQAHESVMLSIGINLQDKVTITNHPDVLVGPPTPQPEPAYARALAYLPLTPAVPGSPFAVIPPSTPPYTFYADFLKPIPSIERIEISWHRFQKSAGNSNYIITPAIIPPGASIYDVDKNAEVLLAFFGKNRRPE
jgi:hypothetical protein